MTALSLFCERSWVDYLFETSIYIVLLVNPYMWLRTIFNLAKVNTVPCMFAASLSLVQQVDYWIG